MAAKERLAYYAERFSTVEVDSTYYRIPERSMVQGWADRTPAGFVMHVKAFGLMTRHPVRLEQLQARGVLVVGVVGREMRADVTHSRRAKQRVDHRVRKNVRVGVSIQATVVLDAHAAQHQRTARDQRMNVVSDSDPHRSAVSCSRMSASTTSRSSGVVSLMLAGSPGTTVTRWPVAATSCASSSPTSPASAASRCARASSS